MEKKDLLLLTDKLIKDLKNTGIPISKNIKEVVINTRAKARFGACKRKKDGLGRTYYIIELSEEILKCSEEEASTVVAHELLHTCPGCFNHGKKWKLYTQRVFKELGINIKTVQRYEELGLERPREKEEIKYIIRCSGCGRTFSRKRMCSLVKNPEKYRCGKCGNILYLEKNNHNIL